jgi:hypothetical protein
MIFSLPNYRHLSEAELNRLRKDDKRTAFRNVANTLFNLLLLAALWGLPYYFCSLVLSGGSDSASPRKAIIGVWRPAAGDGRDAIEFTRDGTFRLSRGGIVGETGHYRFDVHGDVVFYDLNPPDLLHGLDGIVPAQYRVTVTIIGDRLSVTAPQDPQRDDQRHLPGVFAQVLHLKRAK